MIYGIILAMNMNMIARQELINLKTDGGNGIHYKKIN
jgi:hypothetical protein